MSFTRSIIAFGATLALSFSIQIAAIAGTQAATTANEGTSQSAVENKVDLNTATVEQLRKVKGIGAAKAKAIVDYRTEHGPFKSVDALSDVKGFSGNVIATLVKKNPGVMTVE